MRKSTYRISRMDCSSEEQLIRMRLQEMSDILSLHFDIPHRTLEVVHSNDHHAIDDALDSLQLDTTYVGTVEVHNVADPADHRMERELLYQVLAINFAFFVLELVTGIVAVSMGLVGDSLDMLADSIVYGLSLFAVGGSLARKKRIAGVSGYFQLALAIVGFAEVVRRFVGVEDVPSFQLMIAMSILALIGNGVSLRLLQKSKSGEAHMRASMIFTSNDVIVNIGVISAGILVLLTDSNIPDLLVGLVIFTLVARGSFKILQLAR